MKILRIIDVNFNRAREGFRVIEESVRFICKDKQLLEKIKEIRQNFSKGVLKFFPSEQLKSQRASQEDIGRDLNRKEKLNLKQIIETNFFRVEEALRVLEEYSKIINPESVSFFHNLRFEIYEYEKRVITKISRKKINLPCLYVILNLKEDEKQFLKFSEGVIKGKPNIVQLRYKGENTKFFLKIANILKKNIPNEIIYIINDRVDICFLCEGDGVHIGRNDLDIDDVRKILPEKIVGVSTENIEDIERIKNKDIDYVAIGSIFKSPTKIEKKPIGLDILKKVKEKISIPLIGIGGINIENARKVIEKGADGVAVISALENSEKVEEEIKKLKEEIDKGWKKRKKRII
ncbi:MAG: thiamine phosphate synthase [Candidatus Omnitrophica bacterium]|nr:thiamine phosphate synthase [Candidatus Omnitrophota bacterium]MCM8802201.1 thiamine phosphate synthase [Candidatus Omnitrophota bacterium]